MRTKVVLRSWERQEWFRDAVWDWTVEWIDLQTPQIARAVAAQAKRGKINEAKFLLELSGRYSPKGDNAVAAVQVVVQGIPRPEDTVVEALPPQDLDAVAEALRPSRPQAEG